MISTSKSSSVSSVLIRPCSSSKVGSSLCVCVSNGLGGRKAANRSGEGRGARARKGAASALSEPAVVLPLVEHAGRNQLLDLPALRRRQPLAADRDLVVLAHERRCAKDVGTVRVAGILERRDETNPDAPVRPKHTRLAFTGHCADTATRPRGVERTSSGRDERGARSSPVRWSTSLSERLMRVPATDSTLTLTTWLRLITSFGSVTRPPTTRCEMWIRPAALQTNPTHPRRQQANGGGWEGGTRGEGRGAERAGEGVRKGARRVWRARKERMKKADAEAEAGKAIERRAQRKGRD